MRSALNTSALLTFIRSALTAKKGLWSASAGCLWSPKCISNYQSLKPRPKSSIGFRDYWWRLRFQDTIQQRAAGEATLWHIKWSVSNVWCCFVPEPGESAVPALRFGRQSSPVVAELRAIRSGLFMSWTQIVTAGARNTHRERDLGEKPRGERVL